jgi:PKHD-type hydroxylase
MSSTVIGNRTGVNKGTHMEFMMFTPEECQHIVDWAIRHGYAQPGLVHRYKTGEAVGTDLRRCKEYLVEPGDIRFKNDSTLSERVLAGFERGNVWGLSYTGVPSIRVLEYQVGDGYGCHTDWSYGAARERKLSMTVQLSSHYHYKGGRVVLYAGPQDDSISVVQGMATVWPSWTLHEVLPVESGVRYALTTWAHGEAYR